MQKVDQALSNVKPLNGSKICVIIVAAGSGSRFGAALPKQFCSLDRRPVLMHTIERLHLSIPQAVMILVLSDSCHELWNSLCLKHGFRSPSVVYGGDTRWRSVKNAIDAVPDDIDFILVHDGARPVVDTPMIERVIAPFSDSSLEGVIPVVPVVDSLRELTPAGESVAVDRSRYRAVQTPQAFPARLLRKAYTLPFSEVFTDDASVMAAAGYDKLLLVDGDSRNIKITHSADLEIAQIYMRDI